LDGVTRDAAAPRVRISAFGESSPNWRIATCSSQQGYKSEAKGTLLSRASSPMRARTVGNTLPGIGERLVGVAPISQGRDGSTGM
jgi:hypothetical protein